MKREHPLALLAPLPGRFGCGGHHVGGKAFKVGCVFNHQLKGVGFLEHIFGEFQLQDGQLLVDFLEPGFFGLVQAGAGPDKIPVKLFQELLLLRV